MISLSEQNANKKLVMQQNYTEVELKQYAATKGEMNQIGKTNKLEQVGWTGDPNFIQKKYNHKNKKWKGRKVVNANEIKMKNH